MYLAFPFSKCSLVEVTVAYATAYYGTVIMAVTSLMYFLGDS
jgi:hypothetical protein